MRANKNIINYILLIVAITSCSLLNNGRDENDIFQWFDIPDEGSVLTYSFVQKYKLEDGSIKRYYGKAKSRVMNVLLDTNHIEVDYLESIYKNEGGLYLGYTYYEFTNHLYYERDSSGEYCGKIDLWNNFTMIKTPVQKTTRWYFENNKFEIISAGESREVGAGKFDDIVVVIQKYGIDTLGEFWYSPSIGHIIKLVYNTHSDFIETLELQKVEY